VIILDYFDLLMLLTKAGRNAWQADQCNKTKRLNNNLINTKFLRRSICGIKQEDR